MPRHRHRHRTSPSALALADHLRRLRAEFPFVRPFEEDDDNWWNEGLDALEANQLNRAEQIFKKLTLAQPEHFDGYYGLAQVYQRQDHLDLAILFADEAIRLGQVFLADGSLDPSTLAEMKQFRRQLGPQAGTAAG
jgi:tetratricopeptide (TPR) repeat protein